MKLAAAMLGAWLACSAWAWAKGEYTGKDLYTVPNPADRGALTVHFRAGAQRIARVVALGRQAKNPYLGTLSADGATASFPNLPADRYDLLVVTADAFFDGLQLVSQPTADPPAADRDAVTREVAGIEAFFDAKAIARLEFAGEQATVLLQQWRRGPALTEAATPIAGTIHSLDLLWFERPNRGWQLLKRRQLYRDETNCREPLKHHFLPELGNLRVVSTAKEITVTLPALPPQTIVPLPPPAPAAPTTPPAPMDKRTPTGD